MAQSKTVESLKDSVIRYLRICGNLGQREMVLRPETVEALRKLTAIPKATNTRTIIQETPQPSSRTVQKSDITFRKPESIRKTSPQASAAPAGRDLSGLGKEGALEAIRQEILSDVRMPELFQRAQNMVFGTGSVDARIMFIGEAPGAEEDLQGEPFVGAAGQLLDKMITAMGLKRGEVYISNVVKYRPDMPEGSRGNRKPTSEELERCRPHILRQIEVIRPEVIVGLGATAMEGLLNQSRVSITRLRGNWQHLNDTPLMPTFHPAYLLHNDSVSEKRKVWEDLLQVMQKAGLPISAKQQKYFQNKG